MIHIIKQLLTGQDNETHDLVHWCSLVAFLVYIGLVVYSVVVKSGPFNAQEFGAGVGLLLLGFGGATKLKEKVEP